MKVAFQLRRDSICPGGEIWQTRNVEVVVGATLAGFNSQSWALFILRRNRSSNSLSASFLSLIFWQRLASIAVQFVVPRFQCDKSC